MSTQAEQNVTAANTRTAREEAAMAAAEAAASVAAKAAEAERKKKAAAKKKAQAEKVGTGTPSVSTDDLVARIQEQIDASSDETFKARLRARQAAVRANAP